MLAPSLHRNEDVFGVSDPSVRVARVLLSNFHDTHHNTTALLLLSLNVTMMMRRNLLSALLFFTAVALLQITCTSATTQRKDQSMDFAGAWQLRSATSNSVLQEIPTGRVIVLKVEQQSDDSSMYRLNIKVGNIMMTSLKIIGENDDGSQKIQVGPVASTRMMPPPDLQPLEYFVNDAMPQLDKMEIVDGILIMEGGTVQVKWESADDYDDSK